MATAPATPAVTPAQVTGQNVRAEMARRGVSQARLADHLHISQTAVSARLRGITPWDINELTAAATFLEVPLERLTPRPQSAPAFEAAS